MRSPPDMGDPLRVLFVCTANISRSPAMELLARRFAVGGLEVSSAGTHAFEGRPIDTRMTRPLLARGVPADDVRRFRSRALTPDLVDAADLVLTATATHRQLLLEQRPDASSRAFSLGLFAAALGETDAGGAELVRVVGARHLPDDPALDLADAYGRGADAAAACAQRVESLLRVVVPPLTGSGRISA